MSQVHDESDWMAKYFFSGGTMPSLDLLSFFQEHLALRRAWYVPGSHYSATCEAWLANQDRYRRDILPIFEQVGAAG